VQPREFSQARGKKCVLSKCVSKKCVLYRKNGSVKGAGPAEWPVSSASFENWSELDAPRAPIARYAGCLS